MKKNKLLAVFLALAMTLTLLPTAALADTTENCSVENCGHVAAITNDGVTTHYDTLADALKDAESGNVIEILAGIWGAAKIGVLDEPGVYTNANLVRYKSLTIRPAEGADVTFTSNVSLGYDDSSTANATMTVQNLKFQNASLMLSNYVQATVEGCQFVGSGSANGALIILDSCCTNHKTGDTYPNSMVTIKNCEIDGTMSGAPGIRIRNSGNVTLTNNTIENANHNGILFESNNKIDATPSKTITVTGNTITEWNANNAEGGGRAIRLAAGNLAEGSSVTITGNTFTKETLGRDTPDFVKITDAGNATVNLNDNKWNNKLLTAVNGKDTIYTVNSATPAISSVVSDQEPVAKIGTVGYETLAEALAAAENGQTVTLLKSIAVSDVIAINKNLTLNLNGNTITNNVTGDFPLHVDSAVTFEIDGSKAGSAMVIPAENEEAYGFIKISAAATVTLNSGSYTGSTNGGAFIIAANSGGNTLAPDATITLNGVTATTNTRVFTMDTGDKLILNVIGGTFTATGRVTNNGEMYSVFGIDCYDLETPFTFTNATVTTAGGACVETSGGTATYTNCSFNVTEVSDPAFVASAVAVSWVGTANIKSGTYSSAGYGVYVYTSGGTITVEDGTISGTMAAVCSGLGGYNDVYSKVIIQGGSFTGALKTYGTNNYGPATISITAGTFSVDPAANVANGYASALVNSSYVVGSATHSVTFDSNGGSAVPAINDVEHGTAVSTPTAPTRSGYTFGGWYTDSGLTTAYNFSTAVTDNVTLYAKWTLNTYTVTFDSNGGSAVAAIENVTHGTAVSAPTAPTRSGYTFAGWKLNSSNYEFSTPVTGDITLIAQWTAIPSTPSDSDSSDDDRDFTTPSQPTTSTETKPDGSTTTTESKPDGTVTESNTSKPTTDAEGNTSQTTTEVSTGKDGVTESKTETVTKPDGSASSTTESTTTKPDGTTTESKTETSINADGSTASTTTETTTNKDGTVTESKTEATTSTVTNKDGSTTETKQETTTTSTGSKTESTTVTTVNKDGSSTATTTATTTDKAGTVTESKTESTTNKNGTTTEKTTTTETKANGTVTESKTETTINKDGSSKATTTETVTKADGTKVESTTTAITSLSTNKATGTVTETKKETTTTSDGVKSEGTTVTQIQKDGTVTSTETVKASDSTGTTATKTTTLDAKGEVTTTAEVSVSGKAVTEAAKTGGTVTLPVEVPTAKTTEAAPSVQVTMPKSDSSVKVEIPVENVTPGTVAIIVNADGTEKIVSTSVVTENGVTLTLDGSATVKLVDNAKSFVDVPETNVFYNEISSLSARNIMIGVSNEKFDLINGVTLNQVANVAGRITGEVDVNDFNAGIVWGNENGLRTGNNAATRGEVLKALYIAAGSPAVEDTSILSRFKDASSIPADLAAIAAWAAQNGILKGNMDGTAALGANVTRGQACALAGRTMGALA